MTNQTNTDLADRLILALCPDYPELERANVKQSTPERHQPIEFDAEGKVLAVGAAVAPSAKDGPTEEAIERVAVAVYGQPIYVHNTIRRTIELTWQAAREGMVSKGELEQKCEQLRGAYQSYLDRAEKAERRVGELDARCELAELQHKLWRELAEQHTGRSADDHQRRAVSDMLDQRAAWESWCADMVYRNPESHRIPDEHQGRQMLTARLDDYYELNQMFPDRGEGDGPVPPIYAVAESLIGRLRSDLKHESAELERVKAELNRKEFGAKKTGAMLGAWQETARTLGIESWPGALPGQSLCETTKRYVESLKTELAGLSGRVQCVADISEALNKLEHHRVSTGVKGLAERVVSLLTPASDEVTEEHIRELDIEAGVLADEQVGDEEGWKTAYTSHLVRLAFRLARRNHGGRQEPSGSVVEFELPGCEIEGGQLWVENGNALRCDHDVKIEGWEDGPVRVRVVITHPKPGEGKLDGTPRVPLDRFQDENGDGTPTCSVCGEESDTPHTHADCFKAGKSRAVDAQPSSNPLQLPLTSEQRTKLAEVAHHAWYASEVFASLDKDSQSDWLNVVDAIAPRIARVGAPLRELSDGEVTNILLESFAKSGTGRKPFDGEFLPVLTVDLQHIARAILAAAQGGEPTPRVDCLARDSVNGLLDAIQRRDEELANHFLRDARLYFGRTGDEQPLQFSAPRGRKLTDGEREKLLQFARCWSDAESAGASREDSDNFVSFVESLLAPQDEVRVALGVCELDRLSGWTDETGPLFCNTRFDSPITKALSASPGDKWDFTVVARRVTK